MTHHCQRHVYRDCQVTKEVLSWEGKGRWVKSFLSKTLTDVFFLNQTIGFCCGFWPPRLTKWGKSTTNLERIHARNRHVAYLKICTTGQFPQCVAQIDDQLYLCSACWQVEHYWLGQTQQHSHITNDIIPVTPGGNSTATCIKSTHLTIVYATSRWHKP